MFFNLIRHFAYTSRICSYKKNELHRASGAVCAFCSLPLIEWIVCVCARVWGGGGTTVHGREVKRKKQEVLWEAFAHMCVSFAGQ